jgi:hypothetical protein
VYFAPCYSQSFLWWILKKTILFYGYKNPSTAKQENSSLQYSRLAFRRMEKWGEKTRQKLESEKTQVYALKPRLKMPFKVSISGELLINREPCQQTSFLHSFRRLSLKILIPGHILNTFYPTAIILCSYIYRIHYGAVI